MKVYNQIRNKFLTLGQTTREWFSQSGFPGTAETINAILHRDAPTNPSTVVFLAHCLGFTNKELIALVDAYELERSEKSKECRLLRRIIAPVDITTDEQKHVNHLRKLDDKQRKLVFDMARNLAGVA